MSLIRFGQTVLFQGDSVTDCRRSRDNDSLLGDGYVNMIASQINATYPELQVRFINRGISGNRAKDLVARWEPDCLELRPDWVSVLIGINDTWRRFDRNDPTSTEDYAQSCREILRRTREEVQARLIVLEPFVLPCPSDRKEWRQDIDPKIQALRELAVEFEAIYLPLDGLFAAAYCQRPAADWAEDGVHPTQMGHAFIAKHWLQAMKVSS